MYVDFISESEKVGLIVNITKNFKVPFTKTLVA